MNNAAHNAAGTIGKNSYKHGEKVRDAVSGTLMRFDRWDENGMARLIDDRTGTRLREPRRPDEIGKLIPARVA